jgi:lipopolysaccharide biosynthesis regulator YciM
MIVPLTKERRKNLKTKLILSLAALIAFAAIATPQSFAQAGNTAQPAAAAPAKKPPMAKTKEEYQAYAAAATLTDPAKLEAAATDFAQKYPSSELRSLLFQEAMGLYQNNNDTAKTLEMARDVLKYDPDNAVALLTASQILSERTDSTMDKDARLAEADANARAALRNADKITPPPNMPADQFEATLSQLRGTAHEVIGTVAFKKGDYFTAIKEYNAAINEEKEHTDAVVYLRLAVSHDKSGDYPAAGEAIQKAIAGSQPGSQVRALADQEKARLDKIGETIIK